MERRKTIVKEKKMKEIRYCKKKENTNKNKNKKIGHTQNVKHKKCNKSLCVCVYCINIS